MKLFLTLFTVAICLISCGSAKKGTTYKPYSKTSSRGSSTASSKQQVVIKNAKKYLGTRYKYGGTTRSGMDCSGLVYTAFKEARISLPRVSSEMSKRGKLVKEKDIKPGDLVFFKTSKKRNTPINHVGVVSKVSRGVVYFIHSSSSKGVMESRLIDTYWGKSYKFAKRIL